MAIFVTGGTGFVGKEIVRRLLAAGKEVVVLARRGTSVDPPSASDGIRLAPGDVLDAKSLIEGMKGCSHLIHLVGIIRESGRQSFENIHVRGTENVMAAAAKNEISGIVHMSALGARPEARSRYHQTKWRAEEIVRRGGIPYLILRPSIIVGKEDQFANLFVRIIKGFPGILGFVPVIGNGMNKFQPIGVEEVAECFASAIVQSKITNREYALTGPGILSYNELLDSLMKVLRVKRSKLHIPLPFMRLQAALFGRFPFFPLSRDQLLMLEEDNVSENSAMCEAFKIRPRDFEEVIRSYLS